jgi:formylglycine-generating enzyme required for sulfatase activity
MGSDDFYPEERPVHRVSLDGFWMDEHPVTAADFRRFVRETGYVTFCERPLDPTDFPGAAPETLVPGALVFQKTSGPVDLRDFRNWWVYVPGAYWKRPAGPRSTINGRDHHPVVQVAYDDAAAYAEWAGKELPTEAEWEYAARGGLEGAAFAWGDEHFPDDTPMANTWQGEFRGRTRSSTGSKKRRRGCFRRTATASRHDWNVWEWTTDFFTQRHPDEVEKPCCVPGILGSKRRRSYPPARRSHAGIKGGSHLCAPNYCLRYRPAAWQARRSILDRPHRLSLHRSSG